MRVGSGLSSLEGTSRAAGSLGRERIQNTHGGILQGPLWPKSCLHLCSEQGRHDEDEGGEEGKGRFLGALCTAWFHLHSSWNL